MPARARRRRWALSSLAFHTANPACSHCRRRTRLRPCRRHQACRPRSTTLPSRPLRLHSENRHCRPQRHHCSRRRSAPARLRSRRSSWPPCRPCRPSWSRRAGRKLRSRVRRKPPPADTPRALAIRASGGSRLEPCSGKAPLTRSREGQRQRETAAQPRQLQDWQATRANARDERGRSQIQIERGHAREEHPP
jgi:hypothetical protein